MFVIIVKYNQGGMLNMDVNAIGKTINSVKVYANSNEISQYSNDVPNTEVDTSNVKVVEKSLENQSDSDNQRNKNQVSREQLDRTIKKLNKFLEDESVHAEYSVHKELGTTIIKIVDDDTKKVIMELPSEKILNMVASMCEQFGLIDKKA